VEEAMAAMGKRNFLLLSLAAKGKFETGQGSAGHPRQ
jgi:hypothetical protein